MLDVVTKPDRNSNMLPPDLAPYLLSASPPTSFVSLHTIALSAHTSYGLFPQPPLSQESSINRVFSSAHRQSSPIKSIMSVKPKPNSECDSENEKGESSSEHPTPLRVNGTSEQSAPLRVNGTSEQPTPLRVNGTSEQSASLRVNGTSEQSAPLRVNGTSQQLTPLRVNGTSEQSAPVRINGTSEKLAPVRINCTTRKMKRVSFADNVGRPLAEVRFMVDMPNDPPNFTKKQLSEFTGGKSTDELMKADIDNSNNPLLIAPDPQPLSHPDFLTTLHRKMLAVENIFTSGYTVKCTVFINKRPSMKRVFGRYTVDSWQTHQDITAHYSRTPRVDYDIYYFSFQVPFSSDRSKNIQFAVCYEADGVQHWDNNEGQNYEVFWGREPEEEEDDNANPISFKGLAWWYDNSDVGHPYY